MTGAVDRGREAFARQAWAEAHALLAEPDERGELAGEDLERLAVAAHLAGRDDDSVRAWERAHLAWTAGGDAARAALCAFWLGFGLLLRGEGAPASGWLARAERLVADAGGDCAARGYLRVVACMGAIDAGDAATAGAAAAEVVAVARRSDDRELLAFGLLCSGEAALAAGEVAGGMRLLDEAMVAVAAGEVAPLVAGIVYCAVIEACMAAYDLRRAAQWTAALDRWCAAQPDLVPYRGQCLVHRSQVLLAHGAWADARSAAERAEEHLSEPEHPALGTALHQRGELHRLRGEAVEAERAYRAASRHGVEPAPGLALLRLAQGQVGAAVAAIRRAVGESRGQFTHAPMLAACVEIMLAAHDLDAARSAAQELTALAAGADAPLLDALVAYAAGAVALAAGDAAGALPAFRRAAAGWRDLGMPYDAARARVGVGRACRALGDRDAADLELAAAAAVFEELGARPALAELRGGPVPRPARPGGLTARECEVLCQVAAGRTDRQIAAALVISEHTVGRHLQNIFSKLGLSSRAAATAYAYEHDLVR
ncbi:MAG TPA: helix-turn-helix transcriptional regulator [Acidimicrobiales bacterium]